MNPGQFLLLIVVLVLGFAGVFVSPVFWAGLLVVGALWVVCGLLMQLMNAIYYRPRDQRYWLRALKEAEKAGDEQAIISIAMQLHIPWQEQAQMLKRLRRRD